MTKKEQQTHEKILVNALELFFAQGIKRTSINEVAYAAGVTRVTVYRHFANKQDLVREAFLRIEQSFVDSLTEVQNGQYADDISELLGQIGLRLAALPSGDLPKVLDELRRLYPEEYHAFQEIRTKALNGIFNHVFTVAKRQSLLRPGVNRKVVEAMFWQMILNIFDNPQPQLAGLSNVNLYYAVKDILLYGIFKQENST